MPDTEGPEKKEKREFMRETIVKPPMSRRQIVKRICAFAGFAAAFGVISAVSFAAVKPLADRCFDQEKESETAAVQFTRDEQDPQQPAESRAETAASPEQMREEIEARVSEALSDYSFTTENLKSLGSVLRSVASQADRGIVTISSGTRQTDLFGNPVENTGDYAGAIIAKNNGEFLIFTCADAVRAADSISVTFADGVQCAGTVKQTDEVLDMAVISVQAGDVPDEVEEKTAVLPLGNSYVLKPGDFVVAVGGPSGMVHSVAFGMLSYVEKSVPMTDGVGRVLYGDISSSCGTGTFLLNLEGEMVGWASDAYRKEGCTERMSAISISDYKPILEKLSNGQEAAYFGVTGQAVNETMLDSSIPPGVYVTEVAAGSPAYDAGIQNGDIITRYGEKEIASFKELQTQIENSQSGEMIPVTAMRKGRGGYTELQYEVRIRAR